MPINHSPPSQSQLNNQTKIHEFFSTEVNQQKPVKKRKNEGTEDGEMEGDDSVKNLVLMLGGKMDQMMTQQSSLHGAFQEMKDEVNMKIANVEMKMDGVNTKVDNAVSQISHLQAEVNAIKQEKLSNYIDIVGISNADIEQSRHNPKQLALSVIGSFNIHVDTNAIQAAFIRTVKNGTMNVLTVIMTSLSDKIRVMKKKREWKGNTTIFFDNSMTPETRQVYMHARKKAKEGKLKSAFLRSGKVFISLNNSQTALVKNIEEVERFINPTQVGASSGDQNPSANSADATTSAMSFI